jgi:AraC family transcriptional regulator of arabinose operon
MPEITVHTLDTNTPHDRGFFIDRPKGVAYYLFLRYHTPVEVLTRTGVVEGRPGDCLIYTPRTPQWYGSKDVGFRDDWCHVSGNDVKRCLKDFRLPVNRLFRPSSTPFVTPTLEQVKEELLCRKPHWQQRAAIKVVDLFLLLSRHLHVPPNRRPSHAGARQMDTFGQVRRTVHERLDEAWSVDAMAELAGLSESRFSVLYREFFGVSPTEDLIRARLQRARMLLANASVTVTQVARECGFSNIYYFSQLFRNRVGCSPSAYY